MELRQEGSASTRDDARAMHAMKEELKIKGEVLIESEPGLDFLAKVVGIKPGHYLIVKPTLERPISSQMKVNDKVQVVCFQPLPLRFRTSVLRINHDPPSIFLDDSSPPVIEDAERRRNERHKVFIEARCKDLDIHKSRCSWKCHILDISESGCLIHGTFSLLVDRDITLCFKNPWTGEDIRAKVRVVRSEATDGGIRSGLQFIELLPEDQKRLYELISLLKNKDSFHRILTAGRVSNEPGIKP